MIHPRNMELRIAMMQAADEARTHRHGQVGIDHLLLGFLSNLRGSSHKVLADHGVSFHEARDRVLAARGTVDETTPDTPTVEDDREALGAIGIDLDQVRETVLDNFDEDITEDWGRRGRRGGPGRGRGPGSGPRARGPRGGDPRTDWGPGRGRGRRGPGSTQFGSQIDETVEQVFHNLRHSMRQHWPGRRQERPSREEMRDLRNRFADSMTDQVLLEILQLDDPRVATVLGDTDKTAIIRDLEARLAARTVGT